jgi:Minichromosome loss protein, Mcl1, middle region
MDSEGMVSMLVLSVDTVAADSTTSSEWVWIPVLDTLGLRKSSDDSYWPVTVYEGKLICVPLKGKVKYPDATRRPVTATLSFKLPVARSTIASMYVLYLMPKITGVLSGNLTIRLTNLTSPQQHL